MLRGRLKPLVYQRVIIVFFVLLIPVYAINFGINFMGFTFVKKQVLTSNLSNASFYAKQLENQIDFIRGQQLELLNNSDVQKLGFQSSSLDKFEQILLVRNIGERLLAMQNANPIISNSGLYIRSYGKTISTRGGVNRLPNAEWDSLTQRIGTETHKAVSYLADSLILSRSSNNDNFVSYLELSVDRFKETLRELVQKEDGAGVAIIDAAAGLPVIFDERDVGLVRAMAEKARPDDIPDPRVHVSFETNETTYLTTVTPLHAYGWQLYTYVAEDEITGPLNKFNTWFLVLFAASLFVIVLFSFSVNRMIHKPLYKLIQSFRRTEIDYLHVPASTRQDNEFDYIYKSFGHMVEKLNLSIQQNYEQKIALQQSELKQLQSQINPHFLYNSFYNIYRFCKMGDMDQAAVLSQRLASYYHIITRNGSDEIQLRLEYENALDYCEIQRIRFSNRIAVHRDELPTRFHHLPVPRLILQPIIENAFEHAFDRSAKGGTLYIRILDTDREVTFRIEDDGDQLSDEQIAALAERLNETTRDLEKTGILNVCRRIRLKYGEESGIRVSRSEYGGLCVDLTIPL